MSHRATYLFLRKIARGAQDYMSATVNVRTDEGGILLQLARLHLV